MRVSTYELDRRTRLLAETKLAMAEQEEKEMASIYSEPHVVSEGGTACRSAYPKCEGCPYVSRGCLKSITKPVEGRTLLYGGTLEQVEKQLACDHDWHGPGIDELSRYNKCMKCFALERDMDQEKYYREIGLITEPVKDRQKRR